MKVYLSDTGDWSVGIWPTEACLDINWSLPIKQSERTQMRNDFIQMAKDFLSMEGRVDCYFEDECPTCCSPLESGKCGNEGCIEFHEELTPKEIELIRLEDKNIKLMRGN